MSEKNHISSNSSAKKEQGKYMIMAGTLLG